MHYVKIQTSLLLSPELVKQLANFRMVCGIAGAQRCVDVTSGQAIFDAVSACPQLPFWSLDFTMCSAGA